MVKADKILTNAAGHIAQRAASRDMQNGERSMARCVSAFNEMFGTDLTEEHGWQFMTLLKMARSSAGGYNADDYEDGAAYFALAGECAASSEASIASASEAMVDAIRQFVEGSAP